MGNMPNTKLPGKSGNSTSPIAITKHDHPPKTRGAENPAPPSGGPK